ncbi:MAG: N-acetylglucosamine-6-phosphate deacetylase [Streptosporangiaceae bacterium]
MLIAAECILTAGRSAGPVPGQGFVEVTGGVIDRVGNRAPPPGAGDHRRLVLTDGYLVPGFVDLQVNGYFGEEFQTADAAGWAAVAGRLPSTGTTSFVPTLITAPVAHLAARLRAAAGFVPGLPAGGARVLGVHVEGPFIAPTRRGAHNLAWITDPTPAAIGSLLDAGQGLLRLVTLAPERPGALAAIDQLTAAGVLVSVGHSDAVAEQVAVAARHGARMVTHLFNAQRPLGHREPGVPGQALADDRLTSGLIVDLHHVAGPVCALAFRAAPGRIALVTDAAAPAGMPPGEYLLGGEPITLPPGDGAPPVRRDGTLAGSALRMDTAVANAVACGIPLTDAVTAATRIPADLIGRLDLGRISAGAAADLVWLSSDLKARATWVAGQLVYSDGAAATLAAVCPWRGKPA